MGITEKERYLFDVEGFLVVEDMLTTDEVDELNQQLDEHDLWNVTEEPPYEHLWANGDNHRTVGECMLWGEPFRALIGDERITPYLTELLGPDFRYDCGLALLSRKGGAALQLHGGGTPWDPAEFYHYDNGRMYNGLVVVSYALQDSRAEDGGFVAIAGSHKSNFPLPDPLRYYEEVGPWLRRVSVKAGSAIIFTEGLTHGTWPWTADFERRNLLYRYCPVHMAYNPQYRTPEDAPEATWRPEARRMLERPYVLDRERMLEYEPPVQQH